MRSNSAAAGATWATFVRAARKTAGLSQTDLALRTGISRNTISRWEIGRYRPDRPEDVIAVADATGVDRDEALTAAGFRPDREPPKEPSRPADPVIDRIQRSKLTPASKAALLRYVVEQRAARERADLEMLERLIRAQESQGL